MCNYRLVYKCGDGEEEIKFNYIEMLLSVSINSLKNPLSLYQVTEQSVYISIGKSFTIIRLYHHIRHDSNSDVNIIIYNH